MSNTLKYFIMSGTFLTSLLTGAYYIPLPFKITQSWVLNNYSYFFQHTSEHYNHTGVFDRVFFTIMDLKLRHDLKNNIKNQINPSITSEQSAIKVVVKTMKGLIITQRELPHWATYQSQLASLVRGYGACDQINGNAAYILSDYLSNVSLFALVDKKAGIETHATIKTISSLGNVYVDAWSNIPFFGFKSELTEKGRSYFPTYKEIVETKINIAEENGFPDGVPHFETMTFSQNLYMDGRIMKEYSIGYFLNTLVDRFPELLKLLPTKIPTKNNNTAKTTPPIVDQENGSTELKKTYLRGRLYHLHGKLKEASEQYKNVFESGCQALICVASKIYYQRLQRLSL
jgi:hypothetical protein